MVAHGRDNLILYNLFKVHALGEMQTQKAVHAIFKLDCIFKKIQIYITTEI